MRLSAFSFDMDLFETVPVMEKDWALPHKLNAKRTVISKNFIINDFIFRQILEKIQVHPTVFRPFEIYYDEMSEFSIWRYIFQSVEKFSAFYKSLFTFISN